MQITGIKLSGVYAPKTNPTLEKVDKKKQHPDLVNFSAKPPKPQTWWQKLVKFMDTLCEALTDAATKGDDESVKMFRDRD